MPVTDQPARNSASSAAPPSTDHTHNVRAVVTDRGFRRLLGVRLMSQLADGWFQSGLGGNLLFNPDKQASAIAIASGVAILLLPYSLIGPYVGVFLDRWSRRSILFVANALRALLVLPAALMIWWSADPDRHRLSGPLLVAIAFAIIGLNRFFLAGVNAAIPHVVADERLVTANAINSTLGSICYTLGLGSTAMLLRFGGVPEMSHGYAVLASLATLGYLASALLARASFTSGALGPDATERRRDRILAGLVEVGRGMVAGMRHLGGKRGAAYAMIAQSGFRLLYGVLALATLLLYGRYFHPHDVSKSITAVGLVFVAGGLGILLASFITPPMTRRLGAWRWITYLLGSLAVLVPAFGLPFSPLLLLVDVFLVNVAAQSIKIIVDTAVQHECADEYRGRVFSLNDTTYSLALVGGLYAAALTLPGDGHSPLTLVLIAAGYLALAAWYGPAAGRWARRAGDVVTGPMPVPTPLPAPPSRPPKGPADATR